MVGVIHSPHLLFLSKSRAFFATFVEYIARIASFLNGLRRLISQCVSMRCLITTFYRVREASMANVVALPFTGGNRR